MKLPMMLFKISTQEEEKAASLHPTRVNISTSSERSEGIVWGDGSLPSQKTKRDDMVRAWISAMVFSHATRSWSSCRVKMFTTRNGRAFRVSCVRRCMASTVHRVLSVLEFCIFVPIWYGTAWELRLEESDAHTVRGEEGILEGSGKG